MCAAGCDFTTVQTAIDDAGTLNGGIIEVADSIHTEAGIVVGKDVTVRGLGADNTIVQAHNTPGAASDRVFLIEEGATVTLERMTIQRGKPSIQEECGGGILNHGTLVLRGCVVSDNSANDGAGICNNGTLMLVDISVRDNTADGVAPPGYECGSGGGIKSVKGTLTLVNTTVSNNEAAGKGGGVHIACACTAMFTNSTVSGNTAAKHGGGVYIKGALQLVDSTITGNRTGQRGGGVYIRGTLDYTNTVVIDNIGGGNCVIGGEGGYKGMGTIGIRNNTLVDDIKCVQE